jgi:hypothetical protein
MQPNPECLKQIEPKNTYPPNHHANHKENNLNPRRRIVSTFTTSQQP